MKTQTSGIKLARKKSLGQKCPRAGHGVVQEWLKLGCGDELEESELCAPDWFDGHRQNFHIQTFCFAPSITTWKKQSQAKLN